MDTQNKPENPFGFDDALVASGEKQGGVFYWFRFPNNLGASVIRHSGSIGFARGYYELATLQWYKRNRRCLRPFKVVSDTPVTNPAMGGVVGNLSLAGVVRKLEAIAALPERIRKRKKGQ